MVRITLYDPQVSAAVYSERRAAEESGESGIATGLARLGRSLTERERGLRAAGSETAGLEAALGFWESEQRLLDAAGAKIPRGKPGFHDSVMRRHLERRRREIVRLKEEAGVEAATRFDRRTEALTGILEQRAGAMEAAASGDGLADGMAAAMKRAVSAVQADPLQHDAIIDAFKVSLAEMEANGVDAGALAGVGAAMRRNAGRAAVTGLIGEGEFDAARDLLAEGRLPALEEEDRRELGRRLKRVEEKTEAEGAAAEAAGIAAYWAGFRDVEEDLRAGREVTGVDYADETIRRMLPEDGAERMIAAREAAEDRGAAYRRILLADPRSIAALIAEADPEEAELLRTLEQERDRDLGDDPAAFLLAHPWIREAHDRLLAAIESGDGDAIVAAGLAFARGMVSEQRRLEVPEAKWRVLPMEMAADMVAAFSAETSDPVVLGAELRTRFGALSPIVLQDLVRAGLPPGVAVIAAMHRADQREAALALSSLVGTPTQALRDGVAESDQAAVDQALDAIGQGLPGRDPSDPEGTAKATLIERRIYDLIERGEAVETAVVTAVSDVMGDADATTAARRWANRIAASRVDPETSMLVPLFREYANFDTEDRQGLQHVLFSRIPFSLLRLDSDAPENVAWLERALLGEDPDQKAFAAAYLEHTGSALYQDVAGFVGDVPLQEVLSPQALDSYLRYWNEPFSQSFRRQRYSRTFDPEKTVQLAEIYAGQMPLPHDMAHSIADAIQQSLYRSDRHADMLLQHLDRVAAPLDREFAQRMKSTVEALNEAGGNHETLPGRYAFFLSDEELVDVGKALGLLDKDIRHELDVPGDLAEHIGALTPIGAGLAAKGAVDAVAVGLAANPVGAALAAAGLTVAGLDLYNAIDDHNTEHNHFLILQEMQRRLLDRSGNTDPEAQYNQRFHALIEAHKNLASADDLPEVDADYVSPP